MIPFSTSIWPIVKLTLSFAIVFLLLTIVIIKAIFAAGFVLGLQ